MAEGSNVDYWTLVTILGPIILLAVIAWAIWSTKSSKSSKASKAQTERDTKALYAEEQKAHEGEPGSGL